MSSLAQRGNGGPYDRGGDEMWWSPSTGWSASTRLDKYVRHTLDAVASLQEILEAIMLEEMEAQRGVCGCRSEYVRCRWEQVAVRSKLISGGYCSAAAYIAVRALTGGSPVAATECRTHRFDGRLLTKLP